MKIMITGATGFIGGHTCAHLIRAGHDVTALVRSPDRLASNLSQLGVAVPRHVVGDMTDAEAVRDALKGADAVIHCAAIVSLSPRDDAEMITSNEAGARCVLGSAVDQGIPRLVYLSSTSALFAPGVGALTVNHPPSTTRFAYGRAKAAAERYARELEATGVPISIVYPSGVIGPPAGTALGETGSGMAGFLTTGSMPTARAAISTIDVRDLAAIIAALVEPECPPQRVMATGTLLNMHELARIYRTLTGRRFPVPPVPPALLRGLGRVLDQIRKVVPFHSPMNAEGMTVVTRWEGADNTDLTELGVVLRPIEDSFRDSILAWRDLGLVTDRQIGTLAHQSPS